MSTLVTIRHLSGSLSGKSQKIAMQEGQILRLGRSEDSDIKFSEALDDNVSANHAEISLEAGRLMVEDKRSSNGTFLNGAPCPPFQKLAVPDGSRLRLAQEGPEMQLTMEQAPAQKNVAKTAVQELPNLPPPKDSVGKATLLREIDRARSEERGLIREELTRTKKTSATWIGLGLLLVFLFGGVGIGGGLWWNAKKARDANERLAQEQRQALEKEKNVWSEVESRVNPAVVQIVCNYRLRSLLRLPGGAQSPGMEATGGIKATGVLIAPGLILTALHVVEPWKYNLPWDELEGQVKAEYDSLEVQFPGYQPLQATLKVRSVDYDLALLSVPETKATAIEMGQSNADVKVTQRLAILGYPGDLGQYAVTVSNKSGPGMNLKTLIELNPTFVLGTVVQPLTSSGPAAHLLYFDGTISPGNSGGPIVNDRGQLIGIVTTKFDRPGEFFTFLGTKVQSRQPIEPSSFAVSPDDIQIFLRQHGLL